MDVEHKMEPPKVEFDPDPFEVFVDALTGLPCFDKGASRMVDAWIQGEEANERR